MADGGDGGLTAQTIERAFDLNIKVVMVHEQDAIMGGCNFGTFFGTVGQMLAN